RAAGVGLVLADASAAGVLTSDRGGDEPPLDAPVRLVEPLLREPGTRAGRAPLGDPAYILFTSGSPGPPNGVPITHANVAAFLEFATPHYELAPGSRVSQTFEFTFDPSVLDLFGTWGGGGTLVVPRKRELLVPATYVQQRGLTHWLSVPSVITLARQYRAL